MTILHRDFFTSYYQRSAQRLEVTTHGIGDVRLTSADTNKSYLDAGHGKFANNHGTSLSLAQLGAETNINFNTQLSAKLIFNGYYQAEESTFGITEAYLKYKSLPSSYRLAY